MKLISVSELPEIATSHTESAVTKKILIPHGEIPQLTNLSFGKFPAGQTVAEHSHTTMFEVFYVVSGELQFTVNGETIKVTTGNAVEIAPGEAHSVANATEQEATTLYFGIATD